MHGKTQCHPDPAGKEPNQGEFKRVAQGDGALAQAQHAQHGAIVQMAGSKTACRQRHCHGTQQSSQQGHQVEKFFSPVHGATHFGPPGFERFNPNTTYLRLFGLKLRPLGKGLHGWVFAGNGHAVNHAAGGLDQPGCRNIGTVNHHPR